MQSSDFPGFADAEMRNALRLCEVRGWAWAFVPRSAGSNFEGGHYAVYYTYTPDKVGEGRVAWVRSTAEVAALLQPPVPVKVTEATGFGLARPKLEGIYHGRW